MGMVNTVSANAFEGLNALQGNGRGVYGDTLAGRIG
jgi:hypothetical protein